MMLEEVEMSSDTRGDPPAVQHFSCFHRVVLNDSYTRRGDLLWEVNRAGLQNFKKVEIYRLVNWHASYDTC